MKCLICIFLLSLFANFAKSQKVGVVNGTLIDSLTKEPISQATVSIYNLNDSSLVNYGLSELKGQFEIGNLSLNNSYKVVVTSWLYKSVRMVVDLSTKQPRLDLGNIPLSTKRNELASVEIKAEIPPIIVRNDTIEFNAESFKTLPTALVEDLFKKLPGFEVSQSGEITVNGKAVSRILIEGREFFGGDLLVATRNLPANVINKVQVTDDKLEKRRNPDLLETRIPQVINLTFKKAVKQGGFGKVYAGTGFGNRYEFGGIFNVFRDTVQLSVLGYRNNLNRSGFTTGEVDKIGGFSRTGVGSSVVNANGSFTYDNISFGGTGEGSQISTGTGANFNTLTKGGVKVNGRYFFGQNDALLIQRTNDLQGLGTTQLLVKESKNNSSLLNSHHVGAKFEWENNPKFNLSLAPSISISPKRFQNSLISNSFDALNAPLNMSSVTSNVDGENLSYSFIADLWKGFNKKSRNLYINLNASRNIAPTNDYNFSNSFFNSANSTVLIDQLRAAEVLTNNFGFSGEYSESFGKKLLFSLLSGSTYFHNVNAMGTYMKNPLNAQYDLFEPNYSETILQDGLKFNLSPRIKYSLKSDYYIQAGFKLGATLIDNSFVKYPNLNQRYSYLFPTFTLRAKAITLGYIGSLIEPSVQSLQPAINNSNPLFIQQGNPDLLPQRAHQFSFRFNKFVQRYQLSYNFNTTFTFRQNNMIFSRKVSSEGVQISRPINVNGAWEFLANGGILKSFKNSRSRISIGASYNATLSKDFIDVNEVNSLVNNFSLNPNAFASFNLNEELELSLNYLPRIGFSNYKDRFFSDQQFFQENFLTQVVFRPFKKIVFNAEFTFNTTNQNIVGYQNDLHFLTASLNFLFMKADRAQLKFSGSDLLQSNVGRRTIISSNSIRDIQTNNLGRYFLLSFSYNIQSFGSK